MLKIQEIRELIKLIDQASIDEFSYEHEGSKIKMKKHQNQTTTVVSQPQPVEQPTQVIPSALQSVNPEPAPTAKVEETVAPSRAEDPSLLKVVSPMVGTFYSAPNPESGPFVKVGDRVSKDSVVCIVEAMKLFNEIEAEVNGEIVEILVENGQLVEYGQPMFLVKS
jgi:acetyl-CoA carboxylase biotin carboxyl carrier protein